MDVKIEICAHDVSQNTQVWIWVRMGLDEDSREHVDIKNFDNGTFNQTT